MSRRLLISLAFALWCFANTWIELGQGEVSYFARYDPKTTVVLPVMCSAALIAAAMFAVWEFARRRRENTLLHFAFLLACLVPAGIIAVAFLRLSPIHLVGFVRARFFWPGALAIGAVVAWLVIRDPRRGSHIARRVLLFSWPVLAVVLIRAGIGGLRYPGTAFADGRYAPKVSGVPTTRVVWIVFDELSQKVAFDHRPASLTLSNFDRLRAESLYATEAEPPGSFTLECMPSLILGETVTHCEANGPSKLQMTDGHSTFDWQSRTNVFDDARRLGLNTAIVGWFHPYGRVLDRSLTEAYWQPGWLNSGVEEPTCEQSLFGKMWFRAQLQFVTLPLVGHVPGIFPGLFQRRARIERFEDLLVHADKLAADPSFGLVLVHLQVPHPPPVYNRADRAMEPSGHNSYLDSLALADQALASIRQAIDVAGLTNRTALIVSGDHGLRGFLWRGGPEWTREDESVAGAGTMGVPFLVRLPGPKSPATHTERFNTVLTRNLITGILSRQILDDRGVVQVLSTPVANLTSATQTRH